jgi:hypothetical protein
MAINLKSVGWMSGVFIALALIACGASLVAQHSRQARLKQELGPDILLPLATGFGSIDGLPVDPSLHCITLPPSVRLLPQPISKGKMDLRFHGYSDWSVISDRMKPGDDIYAYSNIVHPPQGVTGFTGQGGGFVVLRGWCMVGRMHTWVE